MTAVCDTTHAYMDTQCCKVTEIYHGNWVEKGCWQPWNLEFWLCVM
jgi:hypothetical protein